jgi:hypothetical protein
MEFDKIEKLIQVESDVQADAQSEIELTRYGALNSPPLA